MNSKIIEQPAEKKTEYPCLKIADGGLVVLFTRPEQGTVLKVDDFPSLKIGEYSSSWDEKSFTLFTDKLELSN